MKKMDEQEAQQKYLELQILDSQMKQIDQQLAAIDAQVAELNIIQQGLDELPKIKVGKDLFVPISQGIFVKAKLEENDQLLINVGAGVAVKKTIPEAKKLIDDQLSSIKDLRAQLHANIEMFAVKARQIEKDIIGSQNV